MHHSPKTWRRAIAVSALVVIGAAASSSHGASSINGDTLRVQRFVEVTDGVGGLPPGLLVDQGSFGHSMANLGDIDGDGTIELAVGAYSEDDGGTNRGAVHLISVLPNGSVEPYSKISDTVGGLSIGLEDFEMFGKEVAALGDLDGDGVADLLVGAEGHDGGGTDRGAAYILFLSADGTVKSHQEISESDGLFSGTLDNGDLFGQSLADIGDLDGDGVTDIAVGSYADDDGGTNRGAIWVLFLNADGTVKNQTKLSSGINGTPPLEDGGYFGYAIAPAGDLDGDGVFDLMASAHFTDLGGLDRGAVYTLFLNADGTIKSSQVIGSGSGGMDGVIADGDTFGTGIEPIGDLDGNGIVDFVVGARRADDGGLSRGVFHILLMAETGTVLDSVRVSQTAGGFEGAPLQDGDQIGENFASLGDLDGNGTNDFALSAYADDGNGIDRGGFYVLFLEGDSDGDGAVDSAEDNNGDGDDNPATDPTDTDGDGIANYLDSDDDGDGVESLVETTDDPDGDGVGNSLDLDSDGDGLSDELEAPFGDSDGDSLPDRLDPDPVVNLSVMLDEQNGSPTDGGQRTLKLLVSNLGPAAASGVTAVIDLPSGVTPVSLPAGCTLVDDSIVCVLGSLATNASFGLSIGLEISDSASPLATSVSVTVTSSEFELVMANNALLVDINVASETQSPTTSPATPTTSSTPTTASGPPATLAVTGSSTGYTAVLGLMLVSLGTVLLVLRRRTNSVGA